MSKSNLLINGKRRRGADDEVLLDNYQSHKRYLTEVMASSMNGLSVSDSGAASKRQSSPLMDSMVSPTTTETACTLSRSASSFPSQGDETSTLDSLMSEESDESVGYRFSGGSEAPQYPIPSTVEVATTQPPSSSSPSPRRFQRLSCHASGQILPGASVWISSKRTPQTPYTPAWPRFPITEGRLPPSPNDPCQAPDLRRATLLRNLSMRAQQPAQPTSSSTTLDKRAENNLNEHESLEKDGHQSTNSMSCDFDEFDPEQVGCNTSIMGSPTHGVFPGHVVHRSSRVRSLVLGETTVRPKALLISEGSKSTVGDEVRPTVSIAPRLEQGVSLNRNPSSPRSPRSPKPTATRSTYKSLSSKDGNVSDTESIFSPRPNTRASLARQQSVSSPGDSCFSVLDKSRAGNAPSRIT